MKKIIYFLIFICLFILPIKVKAFSLDNVTINGNSTVKNGEDILIRIKATTSNYNPNEGILVAYLNIEYDLDHLVLVQINASNLNNYIEYHDKGAIIANQVIPNSKTSGMCVNNLLYCGDYEFVLKFQATNVTEMIDTSISVSEFGIATLTIDEVREYTEDDAVIYEYPKQLVHNLKLLTNDVVIEEKPVVVPEKKKEETIIKTPVTAIKSSNNYLKSLEITDYNINYDKNTTDYTININSDVSSLNIKPTSEDTKSTYKIIGNENLVDGSVIKIIVTAEDGKTKEYKINIKKEKAIDINEEQINEIKKDKKEELDENNDQLNKTALTIIVSIAIAFGLIILLCIISTIRKNRQLNKLLKDSE